MSKYTVPPIAALALVGALSIAFPSAASAAECIPQDARDEIVIVVPAKDEIPAVGTPTIVVANPAYVPATDGVPATGDPLITVPNPAFIPAVDGHWETAPKLLKWVWTGGPTSTAPAASTVDPTGWKQVGDTNDRKGRDNPDTVIEAGGGYGDWFFYQTQRTWIEGTPAVGEPTMTLPNPDYVPAIPGTPASGEPTIEVPNPDYRPPVAPVPAETDIVHHDAIICDAPSPAPAPSAEAVAPVTAAAVTARTVPAELAETGGELGGWLLGISAILLIGGVGCAVSAGATRLHRKDDDR